MDWNPNNPNLVGCEQNVLSLPAETIGSVTGGPGPTVGAFQTLAVSTNWGVRQNIRSTVAETIDALRFPFTPVNGGHYIAEVFEAGDEIPTNKTETQLLPNAVTLSGGASGVVGSIDETYEALSTADYITVPPGGQVLVEYDASGWVDTRRILQVELAFYATVPSGFAYLTAFLTDQTSPNTGATISSYTGGEPGFPANNPGNPIGEVCPATGLPWLPSDLDDLDSTSLRVLFHNPSGDTYRLCQTSLRVHYCDENRVAFGALRATSGSFARRTFTLYEPDESAGWAKASGTSYSVVVRPLAEVSKTWPGITGTQSTCTVPYVRGETAPGYTDYDIDGVVCSNYTNDAAGAIWLRDVRATYPGSAPPAGSTMPIDLEVNGGSDTSVDSPVFGAGVMLPVFSGTTVEQEITADANTEYLFLVAVLYVFAGDEPTDDLTVNVKRRSDDTSFGTGTVTAVSMLSAEALGGTSSWRKVVVPLASTAQLVSSTQYYIEFTSSTLASRPWIVQGVVGTPEAPTTDNDDLAPGTFGGGTDVVTFDGADYDGWDVPVAFVIGPDAPTGLAATSGSVEAPDVEGGPVCVPFAAVSWTATSLSSEFLYYELQRRDTIDATWRTVALFDDESVTSWSDMEARHGGDVTTEYQLRVIRTDLISSDWTSAVSVALDNCGCGYTFTSNFSTTTLAYVDLHRRAAVREYEWEDQLVLRRVYGRDGQVAFRPTERELVHFDAVLLIQQLVAPDAGIGPPAFAALRDMSLDPNLPYVAVRDDVGNRFMAALVVEQGSVQRAPAPFHRASVRVVELTETPGIPVVST